MHVKEEQSSEEANDPNDSDEAHLTQYNDSCVDDTNIESTSIKYVVFQTLSIIINFHLKTMCYLIKIFQT